MQLLRRTGIAKAGKSYHVMNVGAKKWELTKMEETYVVLIDRRGDQSSPRARINHMMRMGVVIDIEILDTMWYVFRDIS